MLRLTHPVAFAALTLFAGAGAARAAGGSLVWTFQGIEDINCAAQIQDQNGDGIPDVVVETYDAGAVGDHLWCLSGGAPGPAAVRIWSIHPPGGVSSGGGYGDECVRIAGDLNGDGKEDILLGTAWGGRTAYGIDGATGATIWDFDTYADSPPAPPLSGWVYSLCSVGDVDGDHVPDVFFGCGSDNNRVYHVNGHTGAVFWSLSALDAVYSTAALGDVSGDGLGDAAIGVGDNFPAVWVLRGGPTLTGPLWTRTMPGSVMGLARIHDLDGDGKDDVVAGLWAVDSSLVALSGATGAKIWTAHLPGVPYVMRVEVVGDVNHDGIDDVVVGTWEDQAFLRSGADGTPIWAFPTGGDVWTVARAQDVTGDGVPEVVAGSFDHKVYLIDGALGTELWRFDTGNRLYWVMGTSDLTGNGAGDVFAGTQKLTGSPGGQGFLLEGGLGATAAETPAVEAVSTSRGVEARLHGAWQADHAVLERLAGPPSAAEAVVRFRSEVAEAYRDGELTAAQAIQARTQDPVVQFMPVSGSIAVVQGQTAYLDGGAEPGRTWSYRFALYESGQFAGYSPVATVTRGTASDDGIPRIVTAPNPARGRIAIQFRVASPQRVQLDAYDAAGRRVARIGDLLATGDARLDWDRRGLDGRLLPDGVYFLRLEGRDFRTSTKVTLLP
ncbi:MAG: hypothetical protein U0167_10035 [bacterium]